MVVLFDGLASFFQGTGFYIMIGVGGTFTAFAFSLFVIGKIKVLGDLSKFQNLVLSLFVKEKSLDITTTSSCSSFTSTRPRMN